MKDDNIMLIELENDEVGFMKKISIFILSLIVTVSLFSCFNRMDKEAALIVREMTLDQKIGQMLLVGVPGSKISDNSEEIIKKYLPGGIILFGYNLAGKEEIKKFISDLQQHSLGSSRIPLFISIDQEGGRVKRIKQGVTQFPGNMAFGVIDDSELVYDAARILGIQLRLLGVNMNLAPVLDVNNNPLNPVINTRSFGSRVNDVSEMGISYIKGLQKSQCISVGKHFPGHGDTDKDSHITLPEIPYGIERLKDVEFPPFVKAIDAGVECIMTAHISFPKILHNHLPATISKRFLSEILRHDMGFRGLVITDDLEMKAISKMMDIGEAAVKSIIAGTDIVLISTHGDSIEKVASSIKEAVKTGRISVKRIDSSVKRVIEMKLRYRIMGCKDDNVTLVDIEYDKDEIKMLERADAINRKASKKAIYYYEEDGSKLVLLNKKGLKKLFITSEELLKDEAHRADENNRVFKDGEEFLKFLQNHKSIKVSKEKDCEGAIVYYHVDRIEPDKAEKVIMSAREKGMRIIMLSTGNPFLISELKNRPPALFTFSNTEESIKQMIACLKGEFEPKRRINIYLGLDKRPE